MPLIPSDPNFSKDRDFAKEWNLLAFGLEMASAVAENLDALAAWGSKIAHIFNDAENWDIYLLEHGDAFANYAE